MSNHDNHRRGDQKRTETGPRYESHNPGKGCNSTHVARGRKKYKKTLRRKDRRSAPEARLDERPTPKRKAASSNLARGTKITVLDFGKLERDLVESIESLMDSGEIAGGEARYRNMAEQRKRLGMPPRRKQ